MMLECSLCGDRLDDWIGAWLATVDDVDQVVDGGCLRWIAWAVLLLLPVVEEKASVVRAEGKTCYGAAASSERAAEVVPPGLTEVEAVMQGGTSERSVSRVDRLETQCFVVQRLTFELGLKVGHHQMSLCDQTGAECVLDVDQVLCLAKLPETLLTGPGAKGAVLVGNEAHGGETLERGIDPAIHGDVGGADGVGVGIGGQRLRWAI